MLSILIPVFNYDVRQLVADLHDQALGTGVSFEIVVVDDCSDAGIRSINRHICSLEHVRYKELHKNIGRSKIRNMLHTLSRHEYLLFIDCDAKMCAHDYIAKYLQSCKGEVVVCGGTTYDVLEPRSKDKCLRWYYGHKRESIPAAARNLKPNCSFTSFNFLISKSILSNVSFEETVTGYGYEDTLFSYNLKKHNITITHIDNPLIHTGIDTNSIFLSKAFSSVKNLYNISKNKNIDESIASEVSLLSCYKLVKTIGLAPVISLVFHISRKSIEHNLISKGRNLFFYDILRLGYMCSLK
jgi:glycosyltransferase involved in cell wall biosynthesis